MMLALDSLLSSSSLNLLFVIIAVAAYLVFNAPARVQQAQQVRGTPRGPVQSSPSKRAPAAKPARLGHSPAAYAAHKVFARMPTTSLDCGCLFPETDQAAAREGVSVDADTVAVLKEAANVSRVYLILHDTSTDGLLEAVVKSTLDGLGVLGDASGQVPRHRFLTCTTHTGKVAIIRQLEAAQHIEGDADVFNDLAKFSVAQWLVGAPASHSGLVHKVLSLA